MDKKEHINYWLKSAEHDFETAQSLFENARYDWCLFVGHLVLEKVLKAIFVEKNNNQIPPKTHSLVRLAELCNIDLDTEMKVALDRINDFHLETRYPNYKLDFYKKCTKEFTSEQFHKIEELYKWLISLLK